MTPPPGPLPTGEGNPAPTGARWRRVEEIFHRASEASEADRERIIQDGAGDDAALAGEVFDLLAANSQVELKLEEHRASSGADPGLLTRDPEEEAAESLVDTRLGSYRLERVLGRGGMGVVYLAHEESSPEVKVALKVVRRMLRSSPAVQQFFTERNTLARLEHANIARLLDGGVTPEGMPYVVMEYVQGRRLDEIADDPAIPVTEIVRLLLQLCEAVTYVHRNLILHRDLKPGNVMVTEEGLVKLLDFGTLKSIGPDAADSAMTEAGMRPVTLRYASPEHLRGDVLTTASEVYSLGVILYRLIAGHTPSGEGELPAGAYVVRLRHGSVWPPGQPAGAATWRGMSRTLAGDLEAIVLKALRPDPASRYPAVASFAEDLHRALDGSPVEARDGAFAYRAGKLYRRSRGTVWAAVAASAVLVIGLGWTALEASRARSDRAMAEAGVEQERRLAHSLLFDYFEVLKQVPASTDAQHRAVTVAISYLDELSREASARDVDLKLDQAGGYTRMAKVLGDPYEENLGDRAGALTALAKARETTTALLARDPRSLPALLSDSLVLQTMGHVYLGAGDQIRSLEVLRPAAEEGRRIAQTREVQAADLAQAASLSEAYGDLLGGDYTAVAGTREEAESHYREALGDDERGLSMDASCLRCHRGIGIEYMKLAVLNEELNGAAAIDLYRRSVATLETLPPQEQKSARTQRVENIVRQRLCMVEARSGHSPAAVAQLVAIRDTMIHSLAEDPIDTRARHDLAALERNLADAYGTAGETAQQENLLRASVENFERLLRAEPANTEWQYELAQIRLELARVQLQHGPAPESLTDEREAAQVLTHLAEAPDAGVPVLTAAADALEQTGGEAGRELQLAQAAVQEAMPRPKYSLWLTLSAALKRTGRAREANDLARKQLAELAILPPSREVQLLQIRAHALLAMTPGTVEKQEPPVEKRASVR